MNKSRSRVLSLVLALLMVVVCALPAFAAASTLKPGVYTASRTTSYADPETGKTVDGGTDIALGDTMCENILDKKLLVEYDGDKTYITFGLGMMSYIKKDSVAVSVQQKNGKYKEVPLTYTGKSISPLDGDDVYHYRFEVPSVNSRFRPKFYVEPMSRDVIFFAQVKGTPVAGNTTGYKAEKGTPAGIAQAKKHKRNVTIWTIVICVVAAALIACCCVLIVKKVKNKKNGKKEEGVTDEKKD